MKQKFNSILISIFFFLTGFTLYSQSILKDGYVYFKINNEEIKSSVKKVLLADKLTEYESHYNDTLKYTIQGKRIKRNVNTSDTLFYLVGHFQQI